MPAYNPIKYIIDNTNKNEPGFRYIFSIYPAAGSHTSATLVAQYRVLPVFGTGYGEQDISRLMQSLVTYNETGIFHVEGGNPYDIPQSWYQYDVDLGFEYIDNVEYTAALTIDGLNTNITSTTAHGFIVGDQIVITQVSPGADNPALEGLHTVISVTNSTNFTVNVLWSTITNININGNVTYADLRKTQVLDDEVIEDQEVFNGAYNLFNNTAQQYETFPSAQYLSSGANARFMISTYNIQYYPAAAFYGAQIYYNLRVYGGANYDVEWYDMNNNLLDSASFTPANDGIYAVFVGPTDNVFEDYYIDVFSDIGGFSMPACYFTYDNRCPINQTNQLIYLDRMGSWQSFAFQLRTYEKGQITREQYNQHIDGQVVSNEWVGVNLQKGFRTYNTNVTKTFDLNTNWMGQDDATRFQELLTSPQVYYSYNEGGIFAACVVENNTFEVFSQKNKKLIKQSVTIRLAQQDPING
jgi:hypothetical protein